jgi:hypothetical protein
VEGGGGVGLGEEGAEGMDGAVLGEEVRDHGCREAGSDWGRGNYEGGEGSERRIRPTLENLVTLPGGGAASLAASAACPLLVE